MNKSQEPKYDVNEFGHIYNRSTSIVIPDDEPIFILRGKDKNALMTIQYYMSQCDDWNHKSVISKRIEQFKEFWINNENLMKEPDSPTLNK